MTLCFLPDCPGFRACSDCHNAYMRAWRAQGRQKPGNPIALRARAVVKMAIRRGTMRREPCSVCGATPSHAHHPDYARQRDVVWLCVTCHRNEHRRKEGP